MTARRTRIEWLPQQMYSRSHPITRAQVVAAFARVLEAITGAPVGPLETLAERPNPDAEHLGYPAPALVCRLASGDAWLRFEIEPILASMGVSGERHVVRSEGLPSPLVLRGSALCSGRETGHASLEVEGANDPASLLETFVAAFPPIMTAEDLRRERGEG